MSTSVQQSIMVYDPTAEVETNQTNLAERFTSLDGRVVCLLDNTKDLADVLLDEVKVLLQKDFPKAQFRYICKETTDGLKPARMEEVATCDAVIAAVGD